MSMDGAGMGNMLEYLLKLQDQFSGPLKQARDEQGKFTAGTKKFGESAGAVNSLSGAFVGLAAKIGAAFTAYKALEVGFGGFKQALNVASEMETTQTAFKTMLGSSTAMLDVLGKIKKMGMETPFEFPELAQAGRMLLAFGETAKDIPDTLRRIGDVSSAVAAPIGEIAEIYGKARTQGTLFAEDINQLTGRGIPIIREFANILKVPEENIKKLAEEGKITFPLLDQAFRSLTEAGGQFFGMTGEQAKTSAGLWSNLKDGVNDLFLALGTPLNDAIKPVLQDAIGLADQLKPLVADIGVNMGGALTAVRNFIAEAKEGSGLAGAMGTALQKAFASLGDAVKVPLMAIGAALPHIGEGMMALLRPAGEWLMAKLDSAALSFSSKIMFGVRDALKAMSESSFMASMIPGLKDAANSLTGPAAMAQNDALNASTRADNIGSNMSESGKSALDSLSKGMEAMRGTWNAENDKRAKAAAAAEANSGKLPPSQIDAMPNPLGGAPLPAGWKGGKSMLPPSALDAGGPGGLPRGLGEAAPVASKSEANGLAAAVSKANEKKPEKTLTTQAKAAVGDAAAGAVAPVKAGSQIDAGFVGGAGKDHAAALAAAMADDGDGEDGGGNKPRKTRIEHLMGGGMGGPLSSRGTSKIPKRMMGGASGGPLARRNASPTVPSPGTAKRSQERREAAAQAGKESGSSHPLMALVKEIQTKLNTLAVAK
ncbi:tape measure protein [Prosthecobacter sp.]|uniref:tape measure protein n=1 Tax=Prosthecobacter sp. TaxID=1965333 RepID=UPI0037830DD9